MTNDKCIVDKSRDIFIIYHIYRQYHLEPVQIQKIRFLRRLWKPLCYKLASFGGVCKLQKIKQNYLQPSIVTPLKDTSYRWC